MTNKEAIKELKALEFLNRPFNNTPEECNKINNKMIALTMAIQALEQQLKPIECEDAISREALLKMQYRIDDSATLSTRDVVNVEDIEDAPSVTTKEKVGHWVLHKESSVFGNIYKCSECNITNGNKFFKFCPYCGARMEGVK